MTHKTVRLLLVEEREQVRSILAHALAERGYEVIPMPHGPAAYVKAIQNRPQLVLLSPAGRHSEDSEFVLRLRGNQATRKTLVLAAPAAEDGAAQPGTHALRGPLKFAGLLTQLENLLVEAGIRPPSLGAGKPQRGGTTAVRAKPGPAAAGKADPVDRVWQWCGKLPIHPGSAATLMRLSGDEESGTQELVRVLEGDPGLAASVLRLANSAQFACRGHKVGDMLEAVVRLGLSTTRKLALSLSVVSPVSGPPAGDFPLDCRRAWTHALAVAVLTEELAGRGEEPAPPEAFVAGLLHDLGLFLMAGAYGPAYGEAMAEARASRKQLCDVEHERFGIDHAELGAELMRRWNFPDELCQAVGACCKPLDLEAKPTPGARRLAALVHVSDLAANAIGYGLREDAAAPEPGPALWEILKLPPQDAAGLLWVVQRGLREWAEQLQLGEPASIPQLSQAQSSQAQTPTAQPPAVQVVRKGSEVLCMKELALRAYGWPAPGERPEAWLCLPGASQPTDCSGRVVKLVEDAVAPAGATAVAEPGPVITLPDTVAIPRILEALRLAA